MIKLILLVLALNSYALDKRITLSESSLEDHVAKEEGVEASNIRQIIIEPSSKSNYQVILLYSSALCGSGLCKSYAFIKNKYASFDFAGIIQGRFLETQDIPNTPAPQISTQTQVAGEHSQQMTWTYSLTRKIYEVQ